MLNFAFLFFYVDNLFIFVQHLKPNTMTLLDRLKKEYKENLTEDCIRILSKHDYYIDLNIADAQIVCYNLTGKSIDLSILIGLFYEVKEMKEMLIETVAEYDRTLDSAIFPDKEIERMREIIEQL